MSKKWKEQTLKRKNYAPTFVITVALWISIILLITYTDPNTFGVLYLFFILFFFAIFLTASILLVSKRHGFLIATGVTIFAFMKFIGTGTILNFILVIIVFGLIELYFREPDKHT